MKCSKPGKYSICVVTPTKYMANILASTNQSLFYFRWDKDTQSAALLKTLFFVSLLYVIKKLNNPDWQLKYWCLLGNTPLKTSYWKWVFCCGRSTNLQHHQSGFDMELGACHFVNKVSHCIPERELPWRET